MSNTLGHGNSIPSAPLPVRIRRSAVACITCRHRKIRCDVSINGSPCINCQPDEKQCVVVNSRRVRRVKHQQRSHEAAPAANYALPRASHPLPAAISAIEYLAGVQELLDRNVYSQVLSAEMDRLHPHEVAYLSSQSALTLPKKAIVQTLLHYFFIRIYPCFPVVRESEFREITLHQKPFSLLVFRAMLFAAACYIPAECAEDAGYTSVAHLTYSLYKSAKSPYEVGVEKDPFHLAQAALLLADRLNSREPMDNSTWLAIALHNARQVNAHRSHVPDESDDGKYRLSDLKRFDPARAEYLTVDEVWDSNSEYFDPEMRVVLHRMLISQCRLAALLTAQIMWTDDTLDLLGPNVCVENALPPILEVYFQLDALRKEHDVVLQTEEVASNLTVAVHVHLISMLYIDQRRGGPVHQKPPRLLPAKLTRSAIIFQHAFNLLWFHGDDLDQDPSQPVDILHHYAQLDRDYSARFGFSTVVSYVCHMAKLTMRVYNASDFAEDGHGKYFARCSDDKFDVASLGPAEISHLARICLLLEIALDPFLTGECGPITFETLSSLFRRLTSKRPPHDCSASPPPVGYSAVSSSESLYSSPQSFPGSSQNSSSQSPQRSEDLEGALIVPPECRDAWRAMIRQGSALAATPDPEKSVALPQEDNCVNSLERFAAVTEEAQLSMQEWVAGLEEFMRPFFGP
ncbi:hypothetical protein BDW74DRAFT_172052 [Aspergillus multicolor]|uniref:uncharacterized protein n=1 Tax=Aspergillus multicolor TaxID=41759 RepID=UPI003CCDAAAE